MIPTQREASDQGRPYHLPQLRLWWVDDSRGVSSEKDQRESRAYDGIKVSELVYNSTLSPMGLIMCASIAYIREINNVTQRVNKNKEDPCIKFMFAVVCDPLFLDV